MQAARGERGAARCCAVQAAHLADVQQAVCVGADVDKGAKVADGHDGALILPPHLQVAHGEGAGGAGARCGRQGREAGWGRRQAGREEGKGRGCGCKRGRGLGRKRAGDERMHGWMARAAAHRAGRLCDAAGTAAARALAQAPPRPPRRPPVPRPRPRGPQPRGRPAPRGRWPRAPPRSQPPPTRGGRPSAVRGQGRRTSHCSAREGGRRGDKEVALEMQRPATCQEIGVGVQPQRLPPNRCTDTMCVGWAQGGPAGRRSSEQCMGSVWQRPQRTHLRLCAPTRRT